MERNASGMGEHLVCSPCVSGVDTSGQVGSLPSAYGGAAVALVKLLHGLYQHPYFEGLVLMSLAAAKTMIYRPICSKYR